MRNLILLTIDAWRPDFVDQHQGVALTPSLAQVQAHTARFDAAYTTGPWTSPGLISLFTGEGAARHGVHYEWSAPREGGPALARHLREAGYHVPNLCYLNRVGNYQHLGYELAQAPDYPHGPDDDLLLPALKARRSRRDDDPPFFLWYHYKYVHLPYWAAAPYRQALGIDDDAIPQRLRESVCKEFVVPRQRFPMVAEDADLMRRLYAANVLQMDAWLSTILAEISQGPLAANTTVILTADHGDELLDHGHVGHASTAHHAHLHDELLHIPLLFIARDLPGARRPERVQGADLYPTLLAQAGLEPDLREGPCDGQDLTPLLHGQPAPFPTDRPFYFRSSRRGYQTPRAQAGHEVDGFSDGQLKLIDEHFGDDLQRLSLYDLQGDPKELAPLHEGPAVQAAHQRLVELRAAQTR